MESINGNISTHRLEMIKLLLSDIKYNVNQKLIHVYFQLQNANKSKTELKESILNIKLISLTNIDDLNTLKSNTVLQITNALYAFRVHINNTLQLTNAIDSVITSKQSWNNCFSNYSNYLTDKIYNIEELIDFKKNHTMIIGMITKSGEDAIITVSDKTSKIKVLKKKVIIFYVMIINSIEVITNELVKTERFLFENGQNN